MRSRATAPAEAAWQLLELAGSAAKAAHCPEFEAYVEATRSRSLLVERSVVSSVSSVNVAGLFVRVVVNKKMGVAYTCDSKPSGVRRCVESAKLLARSADHDKDWAGFPSYQTGRARLAGILDPRLDSIETSRLTEDAGAMIDAALAVNKNITVTGDGLRVARRAVGIVNSSGVEGVFEEASMAAACLCVCGKGSRVTPECMDSTFSRHDRLDTEKLGETAARVAAMSMTPAEAKTGERDVVFSPHSLGSTGSGLLYLTLSRGFSGEKAVRKSTFLLDRIGHTIADKSLTISDDPTRSSCAGSRPFDDEGAPTRRTVLLDKGAVKRFMWDSYYGHMAGEQSTGNAVRDPSTGSLSVLPLNLCISAGKGTFENLVEEVDDGYLIWNCQGGHTANMETGSFSFVASPGLKIRKGEITGGVKGVMISGDIPGLLASVSAVGGDMVDSGSSFMPSALFSGVKVTTG